MADVQRQKTEHREASDIRAAEKPKSVDASATAEIFTTQADVSSATAEIVDAGVESGEGFSEDEQSRKGRVGGGATTKADDQTAAGIKTHIHGFPVPQAMKREVAQAIRKEIRKEEREVVFAYLGIKKVRADVLAEMVAKIRRLKDLLASLIDIAADVLRGLYLKWVRKEG